MRIVQLELISNGQHIGATPIREQAMAAAKAHANKNGVEVSVIATMDSGNTREVIVKPDGSVDKVWQREYITPIPGAVYRNRNGCEYRCKSALSDHSAILERVTDNWMLTAHGVQQYHDGSGRGSKVRLARNVCFCTAFDGRTGARQVPEGY